MNRSLHGTRIAGALFFSLCLATLTAAGCQAASDSEDPSEDEAGEDVDTSEEAMKFNPCACLDLSSTKDCRPDQSYPGDTACYCFYQTGWYWNICEYGWNLCPTWGKYVC